MNDSDSFFGADKSSAYESRPKAVNPQTGQEQSWQRASNYASPLDNPHGLIRWQLRELVKGLSLRTDLARMLLTGAVIEDKDKADEVIAQALSAAEVEAKANEGTAAHAALSRAFLGHEVPAEYMPHVNAFAAELKRNGLTPVATEVRTLCVALGVIGHTDWIVRTADGRHLILDVKTGKLGESKRKFAVQCKAYAGSEYIDDGKGGWIPIPFALDQTEAVLAHVDPYTGATALYRVDLVLGFYGAVLAEQVRGWHKIEVLSPYTPVHPSIPTAGALKPAPFVPTTAEVVPQTPPPVVVPASAPAEIQYGVTEPDFECRFDGRLASEHPIDVPGQFHCITPQPREIGQRVDPAQPGSEVVSPKYAAKNSDLYRPDGVPIPAERRPLTPMEMIQGATSQKTLDMAWRAATKDDPAGWTPILEAARMDKIAELEARDQVPVSVAHQPGVSTLDELMSTRNTKPILQKMAKNLGCTDLAHDRKWLALWIIATEGGADPAQAAAYAKSKGTIPLNSQVGVVAKASPAPAAEQTPFALKHIREAASAEDIERFRLNIVTRSGDHAWTDEMAEAARTRVAELAAVRPIPDLVAQVLDRIAAASKPQDIADLWNQVTIGGSAPESWTPELRSAADARLATIANAQPAPPANPYGPQQ